MSRHALPLRLSKVAIATLHNHTLPQLRIRYFCEIRLCGARRLRFINHD
jgi:hypothetical protein